LQGCSLFKALERCAAAASADKDECLPLLHDRAGGRRRHQHECRVSDTLLVSLAEQQTFLFIEMINKAGNLRQGMVGIEPTPSKS
jgi:hypothetical protein